MITRVKEGTYEGEINEYGLRNGPGTETFQHKPGKETFWGNFKNDMYHGYGMYKNDKLFGSKWTYEGAFDVNKKHSYGVLSLEDNKTFQGLYKQDIPFGPGLLVDNEGHANVGFWHGNSIIRLIQEVGRIQELSTSNINKIKVTKFKKWIELIPEENIDDILLKYDLPAEYARKMFSPLANNKNSALFNTPEYNEAYYSDLTEMVALIAEVSSMDNFDDQVTKSKRHRKSKFIKHSIRNERSNKDLLHDNTMGSSKFRISKNRLHDRKNPSQTEIQREESLLNKDKRRGRLLNANESNTTSMNNLERQPSENILGRSATLIDETKEMNKSDDDLTNNKRQQRQNKKDKSTGKPSRSDSNRPEPNPAYILAWNNTENMIDLLKHSFLNRNFEKLAKVNIGHILCSRRGFFPPAGVIECAAMCILEACSSGDLASVAELINTHRLNVNVADNKGNPCFIRAAANDDIDMLYLLSIFGADINIFNDEGFNALNHSLSRYIANIYKVKDWGRAFLSTNQFVLDEKVEVWEKCIPKAVAKPKYVLQKLVEGVPKVEINTRKQYLFYVPFPHQMVMSHSYGSSLNVTSSSESLKHESPRLEKIVETIKVLLDFGIDVNASHVPIGSVILAVFSANNDLLEMILQAGGDPDQRLCKEEGELTCLHILGLIRPKHNFPDMIKILLKFGADPNVKSNPNFWEKELQFLYAGVPKSTFEEEGFNPLRALCLHSDVTSPKRQAILKEICNILYPVTENSMYFGHSYLSMAVAKGNLVIIEALLELGVDPNENVNPLWGNILTTYLKHLGPNPKSVSDSILRCLIHAGANPLKIVPLRDNSNVNTINYGLQLIPKTNLENQDEANEAAKRRLRKTLDPNGTNNKPKTKYKRRSTHQSMSYKKNKSNTKFEILENRIGELQTLSRDKLDRYIRGYIVRLLTKELRAQELDIDYVAIQSKNWLNWDTFDSILYNNLENRLVRIDLDVLKKALDIVPRPVLPEEDDKKEEMKRKRKSTVIKKFQKDKTIQVQSQESLKSHKHGKIKSNDLITDEERISEEESLMSIDSTHTVLAIFETRRSKEYEDRPRPCSFLSKTLENFIKKPKKRKTLKSRKQEAITKEEVVKIKVQAMYDNIITKYTEILDKRQQECTRPVRFNKQTESIKRKLWNVNLYPEIHKQSEMYQVCYQCLKRSDNLVTCTDCQLVNFCSLKCNIDDILNRKSNHKCRCEFYGRLRPAHYYYNEEGQLIRIFLAGDLSMEKLFELKKTKSQKSRGKGKKSKSKKKKGKPTSSGSWEAKKYSDKEDGIGDSKRKPKSEKRRKPKKDTSSITAFSYRFGKGANKDHKTRMKYAKLGEKWRCGGQWRRMSSNEEQMLMKGIIKKSSDENICLEKEKLMHFPQSWHLDECTQYQQLLLVLDALYRGNFDIGQISPWVLARNGTYYYKQLQNKEGNYSYV